MAREAAPAAPSGNPLDALSAVINANIRLPQREPATADQPEELTPALSVDTAADCRSSASREPADERVDEPVDEDVDEPVAPELAEPEASDDEVAEYEVQVDDEQVAELVDEHVDEQVDDEQVAELVDEHVDEPVEEHAAAYEPRRGGVDRRGARAGARACRPSRARPMSTWPRDLTAPGPARSTGWRTATSPTLRADPLLDKLTSIPSDDDDSPLYQLLRSNWFSTEGATRAGTAARPTPAGRPPTASPRPHRLQPHRLRASGPRPGQPARAGRCDHARPPPSAATPRRSGPGWPLTPPAWPTRPPGRRGTRPRPLSTPLAGRDPR